MGLEVVAFMIALEAIGKLAFQRGRGKAAAMRTIA